ncbi:hypothetical protein BCR43DRAFT_474446 [Syncephalastrum racemosum]|uniref:PAS domain-containing protein n=1 Tax=Syncephalastrum racemosum TaxID=13706 RepID=A0A1X2HCV3_SYNRA|nr:hypothetical protein BCR43DRAFT_474446 [Syncephalastrum racemosum]
MTTSSRAKSYISIYDNTATAKYVFVSDSITEMLGWQPHEIVGQGGYNYFHKDELASVARVHQSNVMNERMSSMLTYRTLAKDGSYVSVDIVVHYCYDVLVCTNHLHDPDDIGHKIRCNSVDEVFYILPNGKLQLVGAWNDSQERMSQVLQPRQSWVDQQIKHKQEPRFCVILNRFTLDSTVVFVSSMVEKLVGTLCDEVVGHSFFEFVHERDHQAVQAQLDQAKGSHSIVRLRFDWKVKHTHDTVEHLEAIVSSSDDGLVMVLRLAPRVNI